MKHPSLSPVQRGALVAMSLVIAALVAASAVNPAQDADPPPPELRERDQDLAIAAASGDPAILGAVQTAANANRVRGGDPAALAMFQTVRPSGALTALPAIGDPARGTFSPVADWPLVGIHAILTPDGRVLSYGTTTSGVRTGYYVYDVWDPQLGLGAESHNVLPNATAVDIFCNAQLLLPDGTIEMWGGDVLNPDKGAASLQPNDDSTRFNPLDNSLVSTGKMFRKRWYATATTLPSGEVYIQGGTGGEDFPEVRTATGTFRLLTGAPTEYLGGLYPRNFVAPDGNIFGTRYEEMYRVDPHGSGAITRVGRFPGSNMGASSTSVMFRPGRILQVGGGYDLAMASPLAHVIDIRPATPSVQPVAAPLQRRHWADATVLADGRVLLSGGSVADNDPANGVGYTSELYDPDSDSWSEGATAQRMRLYHSTALLLPDATVLTLGGGATGPELNLNAEVYYPPYLFNADGTPAARPIIASSTMSADPGDTIVISTPDPDAIRRVTLVKSGSVTHSLDMDQRFIELPFAASSGELLATLPANPFETPPGYYLVFIIDAQGVPSEAAMLRVAARTPARLTVTKAVVNDDGGNLAPGNFQFSINGAAPVAFEVDGSNVVNLPPGTYTVTEPASTGYTAAYQGCADIVLAAGGSATCTITNNDVPGMAGLRLTAGSTEDVYLAGTTVTMTAQVRLNGAPVPGARVDFDALKPNGVNHVYGNATTDANGNASASFASGTGPSSIGTYQLTATTTSGGLQASGAATFEVQRPQGALIVRKVVLNENGGNAVPSDFSFSVNGGAPIAFEADGSNLLTLAPGTYTITEPATPGYSASLANCSDIALTAGSTATCTITNTDVDEPAPPSLALVTGSSKTSYLAGETVILTAQVRLDGSPVAGARVNFDALKPNGVNHVYASATTDATGNASASFVSGRGSSSIGAYQLTTTATSNGLTAQATATFTVSRDAQPATLTVIKVVVNDDGGTAAAADFSFAVNGGAPIAFEADGSNVLSVPAGTYSVTEPETSGYAATLSNCSGLVLASGGSATCTITNDDLAPVALVVTAGTTNPVYTRGGTVTMTAHVTNNGVPLAGVRVNFDALKPNGVNHVYGAATTDAAGNASASFVSGTGPSSIGTYQLTATVTHAGSTASGTTTFVVQ
ncbi:galactose oxidase-like domain-containing protein [Aerolutibacter daejeonensis]|uniref:galactose oxidase-like domain-containing protein n=1 Tax=Aerolutibacter daejeonensis TaxID=346181 RepID=UPI0006899EB4|nr:galactose oxidase-like domain-containing protein [Lysobacter daejeonensis]